MQSKLEECIRLVYKKWKSGHLKKHGTHPDEETLVCFFEGRLAEEENEQIKAHLIGCDSCAEVFAVQIKLKEAPLKEVPEELLQRLKNMVVQKDGPFIAEIALLLKEKALEILSTTADILFGQELVPSPVLRSRKIKDFKDEVTILKDFKGIRVEAKIENKGGKAFDLSIVVKDKQANRIIKDLRVALLREDLELESYLTHSGSITFENILVGKYTVQISNIENKVASILLDIKT